MRSCSRKTFFDEQGCFGVKVYLSVDVFSVETPVVGITGDGLILKKRCKQLCWGTFFRNDCRRKLEEGRVLTAG